MCGLTYDRQNIKIHNVFIPEILKKLVYCIYNVEQFPNLSEAFKSDNTVIDVIYDVETNNNVDINNKINVNNDVNTHITPFKFYKITAVDFVLKLIMIHKMYNVNAATNTLNCRNVFSVESLPLVEVRIHHDLHHLILLLPVPKSGDMKIKNMDDLHALKRDIDRIVRNYKKSYVRYALKKDCQTRVDAIMAYQFK